MRSHWAAEYIGKPWQNGASGQSAYDCFGLVRAVYRERLGLTIPTVAVDALAPLAVCRAMRDYDYSPWQRVDAPEREFDVVEMSLAKRPHHVGVFVDGGILTAVEGAGVIFQRLASLKNHGWNIVSCYRLRNNEALA
jgi:cell wall-associated NlpC family hydrolase